MNVAEYPDLGTMLKNRRQECGLTVDDVANRTRIRRTYLQALEENRFEDLPGEAYIHGFLRNYAKALGLPHTQVLEMYRAQSGGGSFEEARVQVEKKFTPPRRKKGWGLWPWLSVAVLLGGVFAIMALQNILSRPEPLPPREPVAVIDTNPAPPPAPAEAPAAPEAAAPGTEDPAAAADAGPQPSAPAAVSQEAKTPEPPPAAPAPPPQTPVAAGEEPLVFDFSGNGLVRLESVGANQIEFVGDNRPPQNYELTASAVLNWKVRQSARISIADPTAVKIWVDQRPLTLAGRGVLVLQRTAPPAAE